MSGVGVNDNVMEEFTKLKLGHKLRYIILKLNDDMSEIVVDESASSEATYDDFTGKLPSNDCRFALYDLEYEQDGGKRAKIVFFFWTPDESKVRSKMVYASSKGTLQRKFTGVNIVIQATDFSDMAEEAVVDRVRR